VKLKLKSEMLCQVNFVEMHVTVSMNFENIVVHEISAFSLLHIIKGSGFGRF